jgi:hypothetical protein
MFEFGLTFPKNPTLKGKIHRKILACPAQNNKKLLAYQKWEAKRVVRVSHSN